MVFKSVDGSGQLIKIIIEGLDQERRRMRLTETPLLVRARLQTYLVPSDARYERFPPKPILRVLKCVRNRR